MLRHRVVAATVVIVLALVAASGPTAAQTGGPVASGDFVGAMGLDGGFSVQVEGGAVTVPVDGSGPLQLTLDDGTMSGTWSLAGAQSVEGSFGGFIALDGGGPVSGSGSIGGPPGNYRLTGSFTSTNTVTVSGAPTGPITSTSTNTDSVDETLTDVIVLCDTIVGRWDLRIRQQIQDLGFDEFIRGYFSASTGVDATEQAEEVQSLLTSVSEWASGANEVVEGSRALYIGTALSLLNQAQRLQAQLAAPSPCPPDPRFMTELTLAVQDALGQLIARFPGITNSTIVSLAIGSGAIGSGSAVPQAAAATTDLLRADVLTRWEGHRADAFGSFADVVDTARAAQMLGIETLPNDGGGISPSDVLLVAGES